MIELSPILEEIKSFGPLLAAVVALFIGICGPVIQRWRLRPILKANFSLKPPDCHMTVSEIRGPNGVKRPVYFFRFKIRNKGKSAADKVEAVLEELWEESDGGNSRQKVDFAPVNLMWSVYSDEHMKAGQQTEARFQTIHPERTIHCDLGWVSQLYELAIYQWMRPGDENHLNFKLGILYKPFSQPFFLRPGRYRLKISIYSANAKPERIKFRINWSGEWRDMQEEMFREITIKKI